MKKKVIITTAVTGAVHIPSMSDYLPITPEQIINEAVAAWAAGSAVVHLHARNPENGYPVNDPKSMAYLVEEVKKRCNIVIGITTGASTSMTSEERLAAVPACKAELGSCNAGTLNFCYAGIADKVKTPKYDWEIQYVKNTYASPFMNTFQGIETYITTMQKYNTKPEFEVYDVGMLNNLAYFMQKGLLKGKIYLQFVMGILGGIPATVDNLVFLVQSAKNTFGSNFVWSCACAGKNQFEIITTAMILGGGVRVGLEDNLYISKGVLAKSNAEAVQKVCAIAKLLDYEIATPDEARQRLLGDEV